MEWSLLDTSSGTTSTSLDDPELRGEELPEAPLEAVCEYKWELLCTALNKHTTFLRFFEITIFHLNKTRVTRSNREIVAPSTQAGSTQAGSTRAVRTSLSELLLRMLVESAKESGTPLASNSCEWHQKSIQQLHFSMAWSLYIEVLKALPMTAHNELNSVVAVNEINV